MEEKISKIKIFWILLIVFVLFASVNKITAQEKDNPFKYKSPVWIIDLAGSFNVPVGDTRGEMADFFSFKNYGLVHGIGFHLNVKYNADKKGKLYPFFQAGFVHLQNDDPLVSYIDSNQIANGYPLKGSGIFNTTTGTSLLILRTISLGLGVQYYFSSRHTVLPFAGIEVNYNYIWGDYEQNPLAVIGNAGSELKTFAINHTSRFGIGVDFGIEYRMSEKLGFVCGANYKIENLIGKKSEATGTSAENPDNLNTMNLLDAAASDLNSNLNKSRNISYLQFYIGFSVFAGKRK